jgi:hypothetical protein
MKQYNVSAEFKTQVTRILNTNKYSLVFPFMNLVNRDGFVYTEFELNELIQFLGEFPYNEVAEFFLMLPTLVDESGEAASNNGLRDTATPTQEREAADPAAVDPHATYQSDVKDEIFVHDEA